MSRTRSHTVSLLFLTAIAGETLILFGGIHAVYALCGLMALLLLACIKTNAEDIGPAVLLFCALYFGPIFIFPNFIWSVPAGGFLASLLLTSICLLPTPWLKPAFTWARRGSLDQTTLALVILTSFISVIALGLWAMWSNYLGVGSAMMKGMRSTPSWLLLGIYIPVFALVNAFSEEVIYRGFLQEALRKRFPQKIRLVLAMQASAFAAAHYRAGFPNGKLGYLMTFSYAMMLGYLRERSEGMLAPFLAHVVADFMIGVLLFLLTS
ncbi:MAG: CPBP family intramembrane glutamic endopeptidase [Bdellovibrionota bacterium]